MIFGNVGEVVLDGRCVDGRKMWGGESVRDGERIWSMAMRG
jgi:hypothetical protein